MPRHRRQRRRHPALHDARSLDRHGLRLRWLHWLRLGRSGGLPKVRAVIQPEVGVAHARAATVTDGPLYRSEHPACATGQYRLPLWKSYRRFLFLSQKSSPATFDAFCAELPPASATVAFMGPAPFFPSWKESPTPTTNAPAAGVYSTQPFGQACRLNANTVCSGRSCAWAGSVAALRRINENRQAIRMRNPS